MIEGVPNDTSGPKIEDLTHATEILVQERLDEIKIPEGVPESMHNLYRCEQALVNIDQKGVGNEMRHIAWALEKKLNEVNETIERDPGIPLKDFSDYLEHSPQISNMKLRRAA